MVRRRKQNSDKPKAAPALIPTRVFQCTTVKPEKFKIGDKLCTLLKAKPETELKISTTTMIARGAAAGASMGEAAARFFQANLRDLPSWSDAYRIVFPEFIKDGKVLCLDKKSDGYRCALRIPMENEWDGGDLLAKLTDKEKDPMDGIDIEGILRGL